MSNQTDLLTDLLPPLATAEFEALKADIGANGIRDPVWVDDDGNVLDGRHRLMIKPDAPRRVASGLTLAERQAFVFRCNLARRNMSPSQKAEAHRKVARLATELKDAGRTWPEVAAMIGELEPNIRRWVSRFCRKWSGDGDNGNISQVADTSHLDSRVKIPPKAHPVILARIEAGESSAQVAADYGSSRRRIDQIVSQERKKAAEMQEREEAAAKIEGDCGVIHGDFCEKGSQVPDASVDLVFTDPPYDEASIGMYANLARFSGRVLRPGGWLLAYSGQHHLPEVLFAMKHVCELEYGWVFCVLHTGGDLRFRKYKLHNHWKPIVAFYQPPVKATWDWFPDVVTGGKEKDQHEWQQAESEAAHFIAHLSSPRGFVCDPFAGSGTTLAAAQSLGRRWIGFEVNEEHVRTARVRLSK